MRLINLTPHDITIVGDDKNLVIPSTGVARVAPTTDVVGTVVVDGFTIPMTKTKFGQVNGLPEPQADTLFVVSRLVAEALPMRDDLVIVNQTVRDEQGRIIGAKSLARI